MITTAQLTEQIVEKANALEQETIERRGYLHERPELSGEEVETSKYLKNETAKLGLEIEEVPGSTGFTALLDTGKPGKTLGIRTDIDALPIEEQPRNLSKKRAYISQNPGVMHACGHDGHMSIVLTTIKILSDLKDQLSGKIYFIFEEGEEINSGIDAMVDHLRDKGLDAVYGNHLASFMETGKICVDAGPRMAGSTRVDFSVHGKGGHGSRPDLSVNPIFAATQILNGLTNAWANQVDVTKTVTLGLTKFQAGSTWNVIPNKVDIEGSLRYFDVPEGEKAMEIVKSVAEHTAKAHGCTVTFGENFKPLAQPVINDNRLAEIAQNSIQEALPGSLVEGVQWFASESFSAYAKLAPICFSFVGVGDETYGSGAEHHNEYFDVDDAALTYGVIAAAKFAVDFLNETN
ncbi:amidohydrolase [Atopococcus tabaci]|uniref:amidohydrolase n=1 Tax=Atopococcus tabaci TaxID=269774 RepID=UPI0024099F80|nr:amidohydrolase [Atopococcus tabaci]